MTGTTGFPSTPRGVHIALTGKCNLRCRYCFYADEMVSLRDLSTATWLGFFDELGHMGVMDVCLTGGEVFCRPDLFELIDGVVANRMRYTVLSNGTLIDEAVLARFDAGKRRRRLTSIQISIDGSNAAIHDRNRPGSFDRALRALRLLVAARFPVDVRVTLSRHNFNDLENIATLLLEDVGLPAFSTNEAMPMGAGCGTKEETGLTPELQRAAMDILARLAERYPGRLIAQAGPQAKAAMYAEMETARRTGEKTQRWGMGYLTGCGCVFSRIDVLHDGTIVPCHILAGVPLGNITRDSLAEVWRSHPSLRALRERRAIPMDQVVGCQSCEWTAYCNGSCPGLAYELTGDFNRANPADCYQAFLGARGGRDDARS